MMIGSNQRLGRMGKTMKNGNMTTGTDILAIMNDHSTCLTI